MENQKTLSIVYFRDLVKNETNSLQSLSNKWKHIKLEQPISDEIVGDIDVASGQSELLVKERFTQFEGLIHDCEFNSGEKEVTLQDLDGFWEIINLQIINLKSNFEKLDVLRKNNWVLPLNKPLKLKQKTLTLQNGNLPKKKVIPYTTSTTKSNIREHMLAARKKLIDQQKKSVNATKQQILIYSPSKKENTDLSSPLADSELKDIKNFNAGFFKVETPVKSISSSVVRIATPYVTQTPKLLSSTGLRNRMELNPVIRKDYSPCMRITRAAKRRAAALASIVDSP